MRGEHLGRSNDRDPVKRRLVLMPGGNPAGRRAVNRLGHGISWRQRWMMVWVERKHMVVTQSCARLLDTLHPDHVAAGRQPGLVRQTDLGQDQPETHRRIAPHVLNSRVDAYPWIEHHVDQIGCELDM